MSYPSIKIERKYLGRMSDDEFFQFCQEHRDLRIERNSNLDIIIMSPVASGSGERELFIGAALLTWARKSKKGRVYSSSTGFQLPDDSVLSPDASWVSDKQLMGLGKEHWEKFLKLCPDFVVEIRSNSDRIQDLQTKMHLWIENGVKLAWLIDPKTETVKAYYPKGSVKEFMGFDQKISGEDILPGFEFDLREMIL